MCNNRPGKGQNEVNEVERRIEDEEVVFIFRAIPLSVTLSCVVLQFKDRDLVAEKLASDHILIEEEGIFTLTLYESSSQPIDLSSIFSEKALSGRHRAEGSGGVWSARRFRCVDKSCTIDCGGSSCNDVIARCRQRFDRICGQLIQCIRC
jgi:hypothetical protein